MSSLCPARAAELLLENGVVPRELLAECRLILTLARLRRRLGGHDSQAEMSRQSGPSIHRHRSDSFNLLIHIIEQQAGHR